jgi:lipopolysaccharide transport system ATP-binding protein
VLGVIGRNGAGKSTLLKILSRITEPTTGRVLMRGRVSSLLEVGTGFHPELSGRDNVFLNGAILGMTQAEIRRKFDEIVAFAGVEQFLDTPVKRYSSGMYVRLAFAVAAHLDPEILIVDEVLAVGDAAFQKKCISKMSTVAREGRTILFVSHNMAAVSTLCGRVIYLDGGRLLDSGSPARMIEKYIHASSCAEGELSWPDAAHAPGNANVRLQAVRIVSQGKVTADVPIDEGCRVEFDYWNLAKDLPLAVSIHIIDRMGVVVLATANFHSANAGRDDWFNRPHPVGRFRSYCTLPGNLLNEGVYFVRVVFLSNVSHLEFITEEILSFNVRETGAMRKEYVGEWIGAVRPRLAWQTKMIMDV